MSFYKCENCGRVTELDDESTNVHCPYCGRRIHTLKNQENFEKKREEIRQQIEILEKELEDRKEEREMQRMENEKEIGRYVLKFVSAVMIIIVILVGNGLRSAGLLTSGLAVIGLFLYTKLVRDIHEDSIYDDHSFKFIIKVIVVAFCYIFILLFIFFIFNEYYNTGF